MATTTTSGMTSTVVTAYDKEYLANFRKAQVFFDLVDWREPAGDSNPGLTFSQPVIEKMALATTALTEGADATPVALVDSAISLTITEYGNAIATTHKLKVGSFTSVLREAAEALGQNQGNSLDYVIRAAMIGGTLVKYAGAATTRLTLDIAADLPTFAWISELVATASSIGVPPFDDGSYVSVIHPSVVPDLMRLAEWKAVAEYSDPKFMYTGKSGLMGARFKNEIGMLAGLRFIVHPYGKLYLGAGTAKQAATDTNLSSAAGDTEFDATDATGIVVGDYIAVGVADALDQEMVQVTAVATHNLTIRGMGNAIDNWGLKYAHADAKAVVEAPNVAAIPVFGPKSIQGRFAQDPGKMGRASVDFAATAIPKRLLYHSWYWMGGFALVDKYMVRGECAVTAGIIGDNQG